MRDGNLDCVRCFFFEQGHELASAAALLGGASAEARVVSCAIHLETNARIDLRAKQDLLALHRLLGLHDVGNPDNLETALFGACNMQEKSRIFGDPDAGDPDNLGAAGLASDRDMKAQPSC